MALRSADDDDEEVTARGQAKVLALRQFLVFQRPGKLNEISKTRIIALGRY